MGRMVLEFAADTKTVDLCDAKHYLQLAEETSVHHIWEGKKAGRVTNVKLLPPSTTFIDIPRIMESLGPAEPRELLRICEVTACSAWGRTLPKPAEMPPISC